jgi:hypothetical protein
LLALTDEGGSGGLMTKLIHLFWEICLLRAGPQSLPTSYSLLGLALGAYLAVAVLVAHAVLPDMGQAVMAAAVDTFLLIALSRAVLWARMLGNRWPQTLSALAGTGCFFELILLPINLWQQQLGAVEPSFGLPLVLVLTVLVWNVAVMGHILRHSLTTSLFNGTLLAVVYMYVTISVFRSLFITPNPL